MTTIDTKDYKGPDRRKIKQRRCRADRREEIRFEPDKEDRRKKQGRRKTDRNIWQNRGN